MGSRLVLRRPIETAAVIGYLNYRYFKRPAIRLVGLLCWQGFHPPIHDFDSTGSLAYLHLLGREIPRSCTFRRSDPPIQRAIEL